MDTNVLRNISYGLYIVSTNNQEKPTGCVANSIMQVTSSPATIAASINHDNFTNSCIKKNGYFTISILTEKTDPSLIGRFGFQSGKNVDKFDGIDYGKSNNLPYIKDACGYIVCKVIDQMETTSHTVFLGEIIDAEILEKEPPMTYAYYHQVIKGKSPKNAPTYLPEEENKKDEDTRSGQAIYQCSICGYVYDGEIPFASLPESFTCPICKQPKSKFNKIEG